jgi:hypothetical protein
MCGPSGPNVASVPQPKGDSKEGFSGLLQKGGVFNEVYSSGMKFEIEWEKM